MMSIRYVLSTLLIGIVCLGAAPNSPTPLPAIAKKSVAPKKPRYFLIDSVAVFDKMLFSHDTGEVFDSPLFPSAILDSFARQVVRSHPVSNTFINSDECGGGDNSILKYRDGMQVMMMGEVPFSILLRGASLHRLGLSKGDSLGVVIHRFGRPVSTFGDTVIFASTQPDEAQVGDFRSRWIMVAIFCGGRLEKLLMKFFDNYC